MESKLDGLKFTSPLTENVEVAPKVLVVGVNGVVQERSFPSAGGAEINDATPSTTEVYSSQKVVDTFQQKESGKGLSELNFTTALKTAYDNAVTWITTNGSNVLTHLGLTNNPHSVTKSQVGLSNVDNTSDANKPISLATQTAFNLKADTSNISQDVETDKASTTKFGSVKAVYDWAIAKFQPKMFDIVDSTLSPTAITAGTYILINEYDLGTLNGKKSLEFYFKAKRTITGGNSRIYIRLYNTVTLVETDIALSETVRGTDTSFYTERNIGLNQSGGNITALNPSTITPTDKISTTTSYSDITTSFSQNLKLRVYILNIGSASDVQQFLGIIKLR